MPLLPSGRHWCIHDSPINELLKSLRINGLRVPELISIDSIVALRPYLRFMWLLPIGADTLHRHTWPHGRGMPSTA